ncbi:MAG: polyprenyl synthetase family protein [Caldicoprobacterales bacterium]|mgnify:FL=1|jgi:geranylgeranyl diphosphate synthase type II
MCEFDRQYNQLMGLINDYLYNLLGKMERYPGIIYDSIEYSLFAGGKRLRPIILLSIHRLLGGNIEESMPLAGGLEMIHTYSLIHDDLPAMDNDDYRRGIPTNHKKFGEGIAILSGDALLNLAYETMLENALLYQDRLVRHIKAINAIAQAAGIRGMIAGQVVDLENEGKKVTADTLKYIHDHKTGSLFMASILAGIILEDPPDYISRALKEYGSSLGLAFQVVDDILDVTGNSREMGKQTGRDKDKGKATYVDKYGLDGSRSIAKELYERAVDQLAIFGSGGKFLSELARFIINRHN